jgi:hypothetical protein
MNNENTYNWQKIRTCEDGMEAQLIKNLLEIEEIPVKLLNVNSNNIFPDTGIAEVNVLVPGEFIEKALQIIQENFE